ncbi:PleD family two-component system response regulator [Dyadobacter sp. CY323]|uniref:response regulator n=1 Tax=Dyadobacter sp. CY323 TaxID=2907302 RepID=UPI001F4665CF|nr:response regulator [Dyadobacter sp. CY323]MCE6992951.1 response regulator [Dyadobacter sp. CY323]
MSESPYMQNRHLIYLVDDDADYRFLVQQVFKMFLPQHQVRFFADGSELADAMDLIADENPVKPRVIILDIDMPGLNGFQTLSKLRLHNYWQNVPVLMMTNRDQAEFRQESLRLGADGFSLKPVDLHQIKAVMTDIYAHEGDFTTFPGLSK